MDLAILLSPSSDPQCTRACLESLARTAPPRFDLETICLGKSGSTTFADTSSSVLLHEAACGPAAARNAAVAASRTPLLCFLSPGTVCLPGWLPPMLALLRHAPSAGCIGNVQREPYSGLIDHAGVRFDAGGLPIPIGHNQALLPRETSDRHPAVSFACCLMTRELFERLGGFDEQFHGPLGDVDFCLRAATLGYRHYVANRSVVYHDAGADATAQPTRDTDVDLYRARWGERARAAHARRAAYRLSPAALEYSRESWERAREDRRLQRQAVSDTRRDGLISLRKHWHRPWHYNYARLCRALVQAFPPLPSDLPPTPGPPFHDRSDLTRTDDGWLFDPPPQ